MILLDTSFFVGTYRERDAYHQRAGEVFRQVSATGEELQVLESAVGETATFLRRNDGAKTASEKSLQILHSHDWKMLTPSVSEVGEALTLLGKYGFSSYTDALNIAVMQSRGIKKIVSFDSEFDRVPGIKRIF